MRLCLHYIVVKNEIEKLINELIQILFRIILETTLLLSRSAYVISNI